METPKRKPISFHSEAALINVSPMPGPNEEDDANIDGFHNALIPRDEYIVPENACWKKVKEWKATLAEKFQLDDNEGQHYDPDLHDGFTMYYLEFTSYSRRLANDDNFNYFIILVIILAGVNVGIQSYPQMEDNWVLNMLDVLILIVFSIEVIVKILSEGLAPYLYFLGKDWKWNNFDFAIVFLSLPFWGGLFGGGSLALLRLVRLMRLAKLIKKIPALQMIVRGLTGGLSSIAYILLLLILVFYLFAVTGFYLFGSNDPFHFKSLPVAMVTMFRCATLDAWSDVMYLNIFGCDSYPYLYVADEDRSDSNTLFWCKDPDAQYILSAVYFVAFIVMSALVMLSLFIGAVTLSMNDSLVELKILATEKKKKERYDKSMAKMFLANSRVERRKQKEDGSDSRSSRSLRKRLMSSIGKMRSPPAEELGKYKTELQLAPALVRLHRDQSRSVPEGIPLTRSAILGQTKNSKKKRGVVTPPPPSIETLPEQSTVEKFIESPDTELSKQPIPDFQGPMSVDGSVHKCYSDELSDISADVKTEEEEEEDLLSQKQAANYVASDIHALEKRKKVLNMIAEKQQGIQARPRFSFMIPESLKERMDRSESMKNQQQVLEVGRLLRVAMGEESHGEEEHDKSVASLMSRMKSATGFWEKHKIFSEYCKFVAEHPYFVGMVTAVIVMAGINVGAQTESRLTNIHAVNETLKVLDIFILTVFTVEVGLKILGEGTMPLKYFGDGWNRFDFIIVVGSYVPGAGSLLTILRLLRLLRVLKLVKSLPQLAVIVNALIMGLSSIGYIGLILFLCFYVFAIAGMMLFRGNDPFHFGNLHIAMFTLFRCSTLDDWSEVLYVNMYGCDEYPGVYEDFPEMCDIPKRQGVLSCIYFISFIVVGAQVLLTLFIGVVTTSMEQAKEIQMSELNQEKQLASLEKSLFLSEIQMNCFKKAFYLLDLDGGGTIEEDEVALGLQSINNLMTGTTIEEEVKKSDPLGNGIDLMQFIVVMANLPRCKHRRLIRKTLKRWRDNKSKGGNYYMTVAKIRKAKPKMQDEDGNEVDDAEKEYLDERPIPHAHFNKYRLEKENVYKLLHSYFKHHDLAFKFFDKNKLVSNMDSLAFLDTKIKRRHSCTNLPLSQYEQYLSFGKNFEITETQTALSHKRKTITDPKNTLKNLKKRRQTIQQVSTLGSFSDNSKNFFKKFSRKSSQDDIDANSPLGSRRSSYSKQMVRSDSKQLSERSSSIRSILASPFTYGAVITPREEEKA